MKKYIDKPVEKLYVSVFETTEKLDSDLTLNKIVETLEGSDIIRYEYKKI